MLNKFFTGNNLLGGYEMDIAIRDFLLPKLMAADLDIMATGNQHLYMQFMRSVKKAKEMLSGLPTVC